MNVKSGLLLLSFCALVLGTASDTFARTSPAEAGTDVAARLRSSNCGFYDFTGAVAFRASSTCLAGGNYNWDIPLLLDSAGNKGVRVNGTVKAALTDAVRCRAMSKTAGGIVHQATSWKSHGTVGNFSFLWDASSTDRLIVPTNGSGFVVCVVKIPAASAPTYLHGVTYNQ